MKINPGNARGLLVPQGDRPFSFVVYSSEIRDFGSHVEQYSSRVKMNINKNYRAVAFATCGGCLVSNGFNQNSTPECKQASDAIRTLLQDPRIKTVVIGQIWGHYQHETPEQFKKGIDSYLNFFRMYGKDKRFFVLLDYPWDNGSYDPIHYINRLNPQKIKTTTSSSTSPKRNCGRKAINT